MRPAHRHSITVTPPLLRHTHKHTQPVYGFLSDGFPLLGYRRRSYLALSGVLGALSFLALASPGLVSTTATATLACTLSSLSVAVSDVVADSLVVEKIRKQGDADPKLAGGLQSLCWGQCGEGRKERMCGIRTI